MGESWSWLSTNRPLSRRKIQRKRAQLQAQQLFGISELKEEVVIPLMKGLPTEEVRSTLDNLLFD